MADDGMQASEKEEKNRQEELLTEAKNYFEAYKKQILEERKEGGKALYLDFQSISEFSKQLADEILENPEDTQKIIEQAMEQSPLIENARVRFQNLPESQIIKIRELRARHLEKMISIEGIIRQASDVRPQVVNAKFECPSCGTIISVLQKDKKFQYPSKCSCGRKGDFTVVSKEMVDTQRLVLEESPESLVGGEQPKRLNVFVKEDLSEPHMEERTTPGSRANIVGVLKEVPVPLPTGGLSTKFELAVEANNSIPLEEAFEELEISEEDEREILELSQDPQVFERLRDSMAPSIWGQGNVKQSLVLQLFGGVHKKMTDGSKTRGDIHILLIGDPGVAKSVILSFMSNIAPKGRYLVGKSASGAGLTASVVKDDYLKGWSLEAGAMVLANKGLVCVDELEKMDSYERSTMHEAMEQQCMLPDFKLMFSNGKEKEIGPLVDKLIEKNKNKVKKGKDCEILPVHDLELISTDFNNQFPLKADRVSRHKAPKKFIKIELSNGREITVTPEHPCWTVKDGKITTIPAEKLQKAEFFPIPESIEIEPKRYKAENDHLCKILGYHISDGCYELNRGKKTGIQFWNNDKDLIDDYKKSIKEYFRINPKTTTRKNQYAARVISKNIVEKLTKIDKNLLEKGNLKKIPEKVMRFPNKNIRHLLKALYDGDGSVSKQVRNGCRISFVSENKELEKQMSDLLLRFGIQSSIFKDKNVWRLDISGQENIEKFYKEIGFKSKHKQGTLEKYSNLDKTYRTITDIVPNCTNKISKIFKELGISAKKEIGHSIDLGVQKHRKFLQKIVSIAEKYAREQNNKKIINELEEMKKLAFGSSRWSKIKKVSEVPNKDTKWVYDVTIEPHRTFISNGMILHNTVTVSKANIQATLNAQTSVLAAANPKFGRFDPYQAVSQQIDLPPTLINRFDIIFVLRDLPDKDKDEHIAKHVLKEHEKDGDASSQVSPEIIKRYVAYAKQKVQPYLSEEASNELKNFYVQLRNSPVSSESGQRPIPISARQLQALIRMSESAARVRLSDTVAKQDTDMAIDIMKFYLAQVGYDYESQTFDIDRVSTKFTHSQRNKIFTVKETVQALSQKLGKEIPMEEVHKELAEKMSENEIDESIEKLITSNEIYRPKHGYIGVF